MNAEQRLHLLKLATLRALADCGTHLLPENLLITQMQLSLVPAPTQLDCRQAIAALEEGDLIVGVTPAMGPRKWRLTDLGRTELT